jgi:predicted nucleotidyltransferase
MRLKPEIADYLKLLIYDKIPGSTIYLFGSRVDDKARGGDIDVLILTAEPAEKSILRKIRIELIKKFGWRKIDLVNFTHSDDSIFRQLIERNFIQL